MSSDSSDYAEDTDSIEEREEKDDLSHLGAAQTKIKSFTVKRESYKTVRKGHMKLSKTCVGSDLDNSGNDEEICRVHSPGGRSENEARSSTTVIQQNFIQQNFMQQQFGDVTVQGTRNLTIGGTQNIGTTAPSQEEDKPPTWTEKLMRRTISRIEKRTKGMVRTSGLEKVMEKLTSGNTWITIKGSPGEGKTVVAFMALQEMHKSGKDIFHVTTPEEFSEVTMSSTQPVIMLDDIFGILEFDQAEWSKWKPVLHQVLGDIEHRSQEKTTFEEMEMTVILIGRDYVLNSACFDMGRISDYFTRDLYVVNMSNTVSRELHEKLAIWGAISKSSGIELDQHTIDKICHATVPHGFPHVCRLFVALQQEHGISDAENFFEAPLEFLYQTVERFMHDKETLFLFEEMIKRDGKISLRELGYIDNSSTETITVAQNLTGTYLRQEDGCFIFDHPSIYDTIAYSLCKLFPLFVIENCNLAFLHDRLRFEPSHDMKQNITFSESDLVVHICRSFLPDLAKRFATEISHRNFVHVLSHKAFTEEQFIKEVMSRVQLPLTDVLRMSDISTGKDFLTLTASTKSPELLKYIDNQTSIHLTESEFNSVVFGVCQYAASDVLNYLIQTRGRIDINMKFHVDATYKRRPLMIAAETKDIHFAHQILSLSPDLDMRDSLDRTSLHYLCQEGLFSAAEEAIDMGADVHALSNNNRSPLLYACSANRTSVMRLLLDRGAVIDSWSLVDACGRGNMAVVALLFEKGATVNMATFIDSPLTSASWGGHVKIIIFLIDKGASVNKPNSLGWSPLHRASRFDNSETVKCLLDHGADVNDSNRKGNTLLHIATEKKSKEYVHLLLKASANVNLQNMDGDTPLHIAARRMVELFPNRRNAEGETPLHITEKRPSEKIVDILLNAGADGNIQNTGGNTSLHAASSAGSAIYVDKLLKAGGDVNARNADGNTALHCASQSDSEGCVHELLQAGADVNIQNTVGDTSLHIAAWSGSQAIVDVLLKAGAYLNTQNADGETALHNAIDKEYRERGRTDEAFVEITDMEGQLSLHKNPYYGKHIPYILPSVSICQTLIRHGGDVNKQDTEGNTPLHLLCQVENDSFIYNKQSYLPSSSYRNVYRALVSLFVHHGANVSINNKGGEPALRGWCQILLPLNEAKYES